MAAGSDVLRLEGTKPTDESQATFAATVGRVSFTMMVISGLIILIGIGLSWGLGRSITQPIVNMVDVLKKLAARDHGVAIPDTNRRDEIGQMAAAAQVFKERRRPRCCRQQSRCLRKTTGSSRKSRHSSTPSGLRDR
jgi:methyl-accepting chemotaxis protein